MTTPSGDKILEGLKDALEGNFSRVEFGARAFIQVDCRTRHAQNAKAWAIGFHDRRGFHVRRIVWGRILARAEKRDGEKIRRATILITKPK